MELSGPVWVILVTVASVGLLAVLHCLASAARQGAELHDLRVKVNELRQAQYDRLRQMAEANPKVIITQDQPRKAA